MSNINGHGIRVRYIQTESVHLKYIILQDDDEFILSKYYQLDTIQNDFHTFTEQLIGDFNAFTNTVDCDVPHGDAGLIRADVAQVAICRFTQIPFNKQPLIVCSFTDDCFSWQLYCGDTDAVVKRSVGRLSDIDASFDSLQEVCKKQKHVYYVDFNSGAIN